MIPPASLWKTKKTSTGLGPRPPRPPPAPGGHRLPQPPVPAVRDIAEIVSLVLDLVPPPPQRLALGQIGGFSLDGPVEHLAGPPGRARGEAGPGHERLDP